MSLRVGLGWLATILWVAMWGYFLGSRWPEALKMTFNEWGDFFAGASAPLAFLWLVIGYFQQGEELGQNTKALEQQEKALRLQVEELKQSVQQQKEMVQVTQQDLEINKQNIERQYQKEKLMAQPLIRYRGSDGSINQGESRQSIKALNIGHLITRVEMELVEPPKGLELKNRFFDNWDYNSEKKLHFAYPAQKYTPDDKFELRLSYMDGLNEMSAQTLYFSFNTGGTMIFSSESINA